MIKLFNIFMSTSDWFQVKGLDSNMLYVDRLSIYYALKFHGF